MTKKNERNLHYNIFAQRLSDKNICWLKKERINHNSWNLLFDEIRKKYGVTKD